MRSLDDASLETPTDTSAPDEERTERTGLMMSSHATRTDRVDRQVRRASSADYVALAARQAEMAQVEESSKKCPRRRGSRERSSFCSATRA